MHTKYSKCASIFVQTDHSVALICKLVYLFIVFGEHGRYIGNINHPWLLASFSPTGFVCVRGGPRYKWWQRWDDVNCRTGVALPTGFPGSRVSEGKVWI